MLTRNVWQSRGLYNGSWGTVCGLLYREHVRQPAQPYCVLVEFDDYRGPSAADEPCIVPIVPDVVAFDPRSGKTGSRQQFPLVLGWAITIHKSQGLTLKRAVLGIGNAEWQIGLTYVGCSRVKSWTGLAFKNSFSWERMAKINSHVGLAKINEEVNRLSRLS